MNFGDGSFRDFKFGGNANTNTDGATTKAKKRVDGKKVGKIIVIALVIIFVLIVVGQSFYTIGENEQGVVTTFGKAGNTVTSGLHVKIPFIQQVTKVNTTIQGFPIGFIDDSNSYYTMTQADEESMMITSDFNIVNVDFYVEYRVSDPVKYLYASDDPAGILKNMAQAAIRNVVSSYAVDDVITTGKSEIQANIKDMIVENLDSLDLGIVLVNITMQDAEPPTQDVVEAFKAVETAKQGKETTINEANKYANEKIPEATAEADAIVQAAEAKKQERINEATAQASRFTQMYEEYAKYPLITKQRMYYEAMEDLLPGVEVIITDGTSDLELFKAVDAIEITSEGGENE